MTSIPKRVVQHGVFLSTAEQQVPDLKPGQEDLERTGFYTQEIKPKRDTYVAEHNFNASVYKRELGMNTIPDDYRLTLQERVMGQRTRARLRRAQSSDDVHVGTSHWKSEQKTAFCDGRPMPAYNRLRQAVHAPVHPTSCVSQPYADSKYQADFGKFGTNPRSLVSASTSRLPNPKTALTIGTTKGTAHIPGYQGFLPTNVSNPKVREYDKGNKERVYPERMIAENYLLNLPRYLGHVPTNACNDAGPKQISSHTTTGRHFSATRWLQPLD